MLIILDFHIVATASGELSKRIFARRRRRRVCWRRLAGQNGRFDYCFERCNCTLYATRKSIVGLKEMHIYNLAKICKQANSPRGQRQHRLLELKIA